MKKQLLHFVLFVFAISMSAQNNGSIKGKVKTSDGLPAEFVSVGLKGTGKGSVANQEGEYTIKNVRPGHYVLVASFIGLETKEVKIEVVGTETTEASDIVLAESNQQLEEVVINSVKSNRFAVKETNYTSKMPLKNLENPQVYSTVTKELLADQLVFNVDDAMRNATAVQKMWEPTGRAGDGGSYFNTRGFIMQSTLRNGVAGMVASEIDAINLERIEVLKGPSATLFGSSLTFYGGAINRVTKKPFEQFGGEVSISGGSYDFNRATIDINTPVDAAKKVFFRLNTAYNSEGSFQKPNNSNDAVSFAPSLTFKATDRLTINADAEVSFGRNAGKQAIFFYFPTSQLGITNANQMNLDYKQSYMGSGLTQTHHNTNFFGQVNYKISNSFTSSTNFTLSNSFSDGFSPYFYLIPDAVMTANPNAQGSNYLARADQSTKDSKRNIIEIQQNFNGDFKIASMRNKIVLGLDMIKDRSDIEFFGSNFDVVPLNVAGFDYSNFNNAGMSYTYAHAAPDFTYPVVTRKNTYSAFVSDVLNITERWSVLAALRVDHFQNEDGKQGADFKGFNQTALSPKGGLVFQAVKDKVSLFANYQNSFNNLGSYMAHDENTVAGVSAKAAKLEQANQIEGGVKFDILEGKLSSTVSYYQIRVQDMLRADPNDPVKAQIQDGVQLSKGIDFELIANPLKGLSIVAGFGYNDSEYVEADQDVKGRRPAYAMSPISANFWLSYRLPETLLKGLGFGFGGNYASDNKILNSVSMGEFTLPAYTVLNASSFYEFGKVRLSAKLDNLTNQKYWIGYGTANPQKLRNFAVSLAYKF